MLAAQGRQHNHKGPRDIPKQPQTLCGLRLTCVLISRFDRHSTGSRPAVASQAAVWHALVTAIRRAVSSHARDANRHVPDAPVNVAADATSLCIA